MTNTNLRDSIKDTFRSAQHIWNGISPFQPNSSWIGFIATQEQANYIDGILGKEILVFKPTDPQYANVSQLIYDLLPQAGQLLFTKEGFGKGAIHITPPDSSLLAHAGPWLADKGAPINPDATIRPWTPSVMVINLLDSTNGILVSVLCGQGKRG